MVGGSHPQHVLYYPILLYIAICYYGVYLYPISGEIYHDEYIHISRASYPSWGDGIKKNDNDLMHYPKKLMEQDHD